MTKEQIIFAVIQGIINLTVLFFVIRANTVVKERLKSQEDINNKMKSFMEIFDIDQLKKFVEVKEESIFLTVDNIVEKKSREFANNAEPYLREILQTDINKAVDGIKEDYDEICETIYTLLLTIPINERPKFIEENMKLTGEAFIVELKNYNEWPTS